MKEGYNPSPAVLPLTGKSRWSQFKKFSPVSRETFRQLSLAGKAPQPERMGAHTMITRSYIDGYLILLIIQLK